MANDNQVIRRPFRSIKDIFSALFIIIAFIPVTLVSLYSLYLFRSNLEKEIVSSIDSSYAALKTALDEKLAYIEEFKKEDKKYILSKAVLDEDESKLLQTVTELGDKYKLQTIKLFDIKGDNLESFKSENKNWEKNLADTKLPIKIESTLLEKIVKNEYLRTINVDSLGILFTDFYLLKSVNKVASISQLIPPQFILSLSQKLGTDILILGIDNEVKLASDESYYVYSNKLFSFEPRLNNLLELDHKGENKAFIVKQMEGDQTYKVVVGESIERINSITAGIHFKIIIAAFLILILLYPFAKWISSFYLKPLYNLLNKTSDVSHLEQNMTFTVEVENEIGRLTRNINRMITHFNQAKDALETKQIEVVIMNQQVKETQSQLLDTASYANLGKVLDFISSDLMKPFSLLYANLDILNKHVNRLQGIMEASKSSKEEFDKRLREYEVDDGMNESFRILEQAKKTVSDITEKILLLQGFQLSNSHNKEDVDVYDIIDSVNTVLMAKWNSTRGVKINLQNRTEVQAFKDHMVQLVFNMMNLIEQEDVPNTTLSVEMNHSQEFLVLNLEPIQIKLNDFVLDRLDDTFYTIKALGLNKGLALSLSSIICHSQGGYFEIDEENSAVKAHLSI